MKQYSEYKDSGVKWIGEIPSHWERVRYKDVFKTIDEKVGERKDLTLLSLTKKGVIVRDLSEGKGKFPKDYESYKVVYPNNLILCLFDVDETPRTVGISHNYGMITSAYDIFTINNAELEYIYYLYLSIDDKKGFKVLYKGLRKVIPLPSLLSAYLYLPTLPEQQAIVSYLDAKVAKIDSYIATATKKIAALDELKQVTIANAVTKGINPNAPMKDSGIPWIGMVPENWDTDKIRKHFKERRTKVSDKDYSPLSVAKAGIVPQLEDACKTDNGDNRKLVLKGDFVVNSRSDRKGSCGVSYLDGSVSLINIVLEVINMDKRYIHNLFRCFPYIEEFYRNGRGIVADLWTTRYSEMKNIFIPVPPLSEQTEIVAYIDRKVAQIDQMRTAELSQIEKLKEYKQRLISDVVTGKVKVTND